MPVPVVMAVLRRISSALDIPVWDGEVQRQNTDGADITPSATEAQGWPAVKVEMSEAGATVEWNFEDPVVETGNNGLTVTVYATTREQLDGTLDTSTNVYTPGLLNDIFVLLAREWSLVVLGEGMYVMKMLLESWTSVQEKQLRTQQGQLLYRGELRYSWQAGSQVETKP